MRCPRLDGLVACALLALAVAGVVAVGDALALPSAVMLGGSGLALAAAAAVVLAVVRYGVEALGLALLGLAVATSTWNAVGVGPVQLPHVVLGLACLVWGVVALVRGQPLIAPSWLWVLAGAIVVAAVATLLRPPDVAGFAMRYVGDVATPPVPGGGGGRDDLAGAVTWLLLLLAPALAIGLAAPGRPALVPVLADVWVLGAVVNAAVALTDEAGLTTVSARLLPIIDVGGRQAGLTVQPNHAAVALAIALPVAVWRVARARDLVTASLAGAAAFVLVAGLVTTESRAGIAAAGVAVVAVVVLDARARRALPGLATLGVVAAVAVLVAVPGVLAAASGRLRLDGSGGADTSDEVRAGLARQALVDIEASPWHGIGLQVADQAHDIYLQLLAAGGVVLLLGFLAAWAGFFGEARDRDRDGVAIARPIAISGATFLVAGVVTNILTDLYVAVPLVLMAGLWSQARHDPAPAPVPVREALPS